MCPLPKTLLEAGLLCLGLAATAPVLGAPDHAAEQKRILALLNSSSVEDRIGGSRALFYSGITDEAFFDEIDRRLRAMQDAIMAAGKDRTDGEEIAWLAKALATSGNPRYLNTFERLKVIPPGHLSMGTARHFEQASGVLADFRRWNPILNSESGHRAGQTWATTAVINMLGSGDVELQREGVRKIPGLSTEERGPAYDAVEAQLLANYMGMLRNPRRADLLNWYCKGLGESGDPKYRATLATVAAETSSEALQERCDRAIQQIDEAAGRRGRP